MGAVGAAVGAGIGAAASSSGSVLSGLNGTGLGATVGRAALGNVLTQGIGVATGLQRKFDWRGVAASTVAAGVGWGVGEMIGRAQYGDAWTKASANARAGIASADWGNTLVRAVGSGVVAGAASSLVRRRRVDWGSVMQDAIGSAVGNLVVEQMKALDAPSSPAGGVAAAAGPIPTAGDAAAERAARARAFFGDLSNEEIAKLSARLEGRFIDALNGDTVQVASLGGGAAAPGWALADKAAGLADDLRGYWQSLKEGVAERSAAFLDGLENRVPGLARAMQTVTESMPEIVAAAKQEFIEAAPDLAIDVALAVGGALLAKFTAGASLAVSIGTVARRVDKALTLAEGVYQAIDGATRLVNELPSLLSEGGIAQAAKSKILGVVTSASGKQADSIEELIKAMPEAARKTLPGLENAQIQRALGSVMGMADDALALATNKFTKNSALLSAAANAVYRHGDVAERVTGFVLEHSGLFDTQAVNFNGNRFQPTGPIQNRSGHGIDWIGRALTGRFTGEFVAVEVKAGLNGLARGLSSAQVGVNQFADSRVKLAAGGRGQWGPNAASQDTRDFAQYVNREMMGKTYNGFLIQHDNMRSGPTQIRISPWR